MTKEEKIFRDAEKEYVEKYWSESEGSRIIAGLGFHAGVTCALKAVMREVDFAAVNGYKFPVLHVMNFIANSLGDDKRD